tara:strand:- start:9954 stop:11519 length:1566 start_codon:yes stop_codon:yes gene_type:complete
LTIWNTLQTHRQRLDKIPTAELLKDDQRGSKLTFDVAGCHFDLSRQRFDLSALDDLLALARDADVESLRDALFAGDKINVSENRPVLHMALRDGVPNLAANLVAEISTARQKLYQCAESIRSGTWRGHSNKPITDVVHIGIGGSHLGPELITQALSKYATASPKIHFVANIDGSDLARTLGSLNPETTLFIVASKSFSTLETLENARSARNWFLERTCNTAAIAQHFIGITNNIAAAKQFGLIEENLFAIWSWVGGRYSLWSAMGLPAAIAIGSENFDKLLNGAAQVDKHFVQTSDTENLPLICALAGLWNYNLLGCQSLAVLSYDERLGLLPDYLQQLEMESNGKSVSRQGDSLDYTTMPILWGGRGTNGQHAYHQLLHQGTSAYAADIIIVGQDATNLPNHRNWLNANALGQAQAMADGWIPKSADDRYRAIAGQHPISIILMDELGPTQLGALLAIYEHKVFCQGALWNINSFDQWGVELGKKLAGPIYRSLNDDHSMNLSYDNATNALIAKLKNPQG